MRLCSLELVLCAALLPISGLRLIKQRRQWGEAGGCDVHIWGAVLNAGGGQDTPAPCETSDIGPDKERWGDCCDDLPNGDREEGRVAGAREARHCRVACILDGVMAPVPCICGDLAQPVVDADCL